MENAKTSMVDFECGFQSLLSFQLEVSHKIK